MTRDWEEGEGERYLASSAVSLCMHDETTEMGGNFM